MSETNAEAVATEAIAPSIAAKKVPFWPVTMNYISLILSFVGIFVASVLSLTHLLGASVPCGDKGGCDIVTNSGPSQLFGIPVAYLGLASYIVLALISVVRAYRGLSRTAALGIIALIVSGVGALFSFYLQFVSFTQIQAVCYWCLTSALTMCVLFLVQAYIAQNEIPDTMVGRKEVAVTLTVGLSLFCGLGLGFEALNISHAGGGTRELKYGDASTAELTKLVLTEDSLKLGPDDAPIKIVEFSDLVCPSCKAIYPDVKAVVEGSNGKVQLILRHRPLTHNPDHKMALPAAFIAEYARDTGKAWNFVDAMYQHDNEDLQTLDQIYAVAKSVGINIDEAKKHMNDNDPAFKRVLRDLDTSDKIDVATTPTFVLFIPKKKPQVLMGHDILNAMDMPDAQFYVKGKSR